MDSPFRPAPAEPAATPAAPRFYWIALAAVVVAAGAVRIAALGNDLWLDEIWSLRLVGALHSPAEILTRLWHDNNHPLNSLFLYLLGPAQAGWHYRLLSWFAGTATVALAGLIGRRQYRLLHPGESAAPADAAALFTATLVGGAYLLIHYSSEARGYAPAVGFGFLALYALLRGADRPAGGWAMVYGVACGLGLLAHLVAFQILAGGLAWWAVNALQTRTRWREHLKTFAGWHLGPMIFFGAYYLGFVRHVEIGGGPQLSLVNVLGTLSAFTLGLPENLGVTVALPVLLGVTLLALGLVWRRDRGLGAFFAAAIFVAPALGLLASRFVLLYPRYFIVSAAGALLLAGYVLARLWAAGRAGRAFGVVVLAAALVGNGQHTARLLRDGRGQYQAALRHMAEHTPAGVITVASDSDFRNYGVIEYYAATVGPAHTVQYIPGDQMLPGGPQWVLLHRLDGEAAPRAGLAGADGTRFRLEHTYPHAPLSGWTWYLYRNLDPGVLPATR